MEVSTPKIPLKTWVFWNFPILFEFLRKIGCVGFEVILEIYINRLSPHFKKLIRDKLFL